MKHGFNLMKRTVSFLLAVTMMGFLLFGCGRAPHDTPYTYRVPADAADDRQWTVNVDDDSVVSYAVQDAQDGGTDVVFTGIKKGSTNATVYLARAGASVQDADDVYVLTLRVDGHRNVTEPEPYGAYVVRLNGDVAGSEWSVDCSDERIVRWKEDRDYPKKSSEEDGMQDFTQIYTFTGRRPGAAHVRICVSYPWAEGAENVREDFWLLVDSEYRVSLLETTDFESFVISEQGTSAIHDVFEAERTADGVRLSHFDATYSWSYETDDYEETRENETVLEGGEALYKYLAGVVHKCGIPDWDGFHGTNSHVLDGKMFSFKAKLSDGTSVSASGSNAFPEHYRDFCSDLYAVMRANAQQDGNE